ncbi:MAG: outer membrane lipoprotein carrier protein LolA, partial [Candidatus Aminicenantes bacterium]|nr:outer membrane lipoprotein carrier protein LolA [Candidatus Aminicenantes bacterium]
FQADFEQTYTSSSISIPLKETGRIYFQKPDTMKWEYKIPEEKVFLSGEGMFQYYIPEDNQLIRGSVPREGHEGEILLILSGQKKISAGYTVEMIAPEGESAPLYKLVPKEEGYYSHHHLVIDERTGLIQTLTLYDWTGNRTEIRFSDIQTDVRFKSDIFRLKVPEDVEIIEY